MKRKPLHQPHRNPVQLVHVHGYAKVGGTWRCVQDFYAIGHRPETGCGQVWP